MVGKHGACFQIHNAALSSSTGPIMWELLEGANFFDLYCYLIRLGHQIFLCASMRMQIFGLT